MKHKNIAIFVPHAGCPHRCSFCDQSTITAQQCLPRAEDVRRICQAAFAQIGDTSETEIAFFGGSFTAIQRDYMHELLQAAAPFAGQCKGIRISTRPDCIDADILEILKKHRVSAIELGAQSLDDAVLAANERGHTAEDVFRASKMIREAGFELGLQVMPGLYKSTAHSDFMTMEAVCRIRPDTVRIYPVVILQGTRLAVLYASGAYQPRPFGDMVTEVASHIRCYQEDGIRIIKVGLHASEFVAQDAVGGYYHPAFRELCESETYRLRMETAIAQKAGDLPGTGPRHPEVWTENRTFAVHPSCISKAVGQKKANLRYFWETYGIRVKIIGDGSVLPGQVIIREN